MLTGIVLSEPAHKVVGHTDIAFLEKSALQYIYEVHICILPASPDERYSEAWRATR